ncbi:hypothetical protein AAMO2058_001257500 [Amorphochlora amoebiformis]
MYQHNPSRSKEAVARKYGKKRCFLNRKDVLSQSTFTRESRLKQHRLLVRYISTILLLVALVEFCVDSFPHRIRGFDDIERKVFTDVTYPYRLSEGIANEIRSSTYFNGLIALRHAADVASHIQEEVTFLSPYVGDTDKPESLAPRARVPSKGLCLLFRLMTLHPTGHELGVILQQRHLTTKG